MSQSSGSNLRDRRSRASARCRVASPPVAIAARHARQRHRRSVAQAPLRRLGRRHAGRRGSAFPSARRDRRRACRALSPSVSPAAMPASRSRPMSRGEIENLPAEQIQPARIDAGGLVIFVDQRFESAQRPIAFGAGQRRRQVVDDDRRRAALGLGALARIVDDEGIEMRQRPERRFPGSSPPTAPAPCPAAIRDCRACPCGRRRARRSHRAARNGRRDSRAAAAGRAMIARLGIDVVAARRLDRRRRRCRSGSTGRPKAPPRARRRIGLRLAPALTPPASDLTGSDREEVLVIRERKRLADLPQSGARHWSAGAADASSARRHRPE